MGAITAKLAPKTPVEVWFHDEMRLGQKNPRTRRWARRGTRPRALADLRERIFVGNALDLYGDRLLVPNR